MGKPLRVGSPEYYDLVRSLKGAENGKVVLRSMGKEFRLQGKPVLQSVKKSALGTPSKGQNARRGRPSLRRSLSKSAVLQVKVQKDAVMIVKIAGKKMPKGMQGLPPYIEGQNARLRHPTFGHDPWVRQTPHPFFWNAVEPYRTRVAAGMDDVLQKIAEDLGESE